MYSFSLSVIFLSIKTMHRQSVMILFLIHPSSRSSICRSFSVYSVHCRSLENIRYSNAVNTSSVSSVTFSMSPLARDLGI